MTLDSLVSIAHAGARVIDASLLTTVDFAESSGTAWLLTGAGVEAFAAETASTATNTRQLFATSSEVMNFDLLFLDRLCLTADAFAALEWAL